MALITGGAGGIGLAIARRFAQAGAHIALADIRRDATEQAAADLRELGRRAIGLAGDVSKSADAEA
ncbi:MAG: SDR family NAD(P)-dependent oxidoreductase, partial [Gammaproteobacteria bacterium]